MLNFYPRSPCGERLEEVSGDTWARDFYPRSPCGERRPSFCGLPSKAGISIHALLAESDPPRVLREPATTRFLSTLSLRRATPAGAVFLYFIPISIHALLAESDSQQPTGTTRTTYFYPRSPCGERHILCAVSVQIGGFLSTLSLRRATCIIDIINNVIDNFYPRSPCGERLNQLIRPT